MFLFRSANSQSIRYEHTQSQPVGAVSNAVEPRATQHAVQVSSAHSGGGRGHARAGAGTICIGIIYEIFLCHDAALQSTSKTSIQVGGRWNKPPAPQRPMGVAVTISQSPYANASGQGHTRAASADFGGSNRVR